MCLSRKGRIPDGGQEQALRRNGTASPAAVAGQYHRFKFCNAHAVLAYFQQRAGNGPHHAPQKPVGLNVKYPQRPPLLPVGLSDVAAKGMHLGFHPAETLKITMLQKQGSGGIHGGQVQRKAKKIAFMGPKGVFPAAQVVFIAAGSGRKAGMKIRADPPQAHDSNAGRQHFVEAEEQRFGLGQQVRAGPVEVGKLLAGVYARVSTA